jgi:glycosyltransferase involved in cell wall biosynthesis
MNVLFATYPMAFHTPGGGEMQLLAYQKYLPTYNINVNLFNMWKPHFLNHDIVHFFSCVGGSAHFCAFIKQIGLPLVISSSLWITEENKNNYPIDEIRNQLLLADKVVTNSIMESDTLSKVLNLPREKFFTVYNGVNTDFFTPTDENIFRNHFNIHDRFILNVGNIESRKNQLRLIQAIQKIKDVKLVLIGHVRDSAYLEEILSIGHHQVIYLNALPHDSLLLRSAYRACEVFALPSTLETPGLAALEAAAQNTKLVLTKEGSCIEYFNNEAIFVDPLSIESIQQGILLALTEGKNKTNFSTISNYTWDNTVKGLAKLYQSIITPNNLT